MRIARRFNAGERSRKWPVPKGRLTDAVMDVGPAVPSGLNCGASLFPALKRRAFFPMSLRDNDSPVLTQTVRRTSNTGIH